MANEGIPDPTYNGTEVSWVDLRTTVLINGVTQFVPIDYSAISLESTRETAQTFARGYPRKSTTGKVSHTASVTYWTSGIDALLEQLDTVARQLGYVVGNTSRVGMVPLTISLKFFPLGSNILHERVIYGARIGKLAMSASEGADAQTEDMDLTAISEIKYIINGKEVGI